MSGILSPIQGEEYEEVVRERRGEGRGDQAMILVH